jgi:hypothetical protein
VHEGEETGNQYCSTTGEQHQHIRLNIHPDLNRCHAAELSTAGPEPTSSKHSVHFKFDHNSCAQTTQQTASGEPTGAAATCNDFDLDDYDTCCGTKPSSSSSITFILDYEYQCASSSGSTSANSRWPKYATSPGSAGYAEHRCSSANITSFGWSE